MTASDPLLRWAVEVHRAARLAAARHAGTTAEAPYRQVAGLLALRLNEYRLNRRLDPDAPASLAYTATTAARMLNGTGSPRWLGTIDHPPRPVRPLFR